MNNVPKGFPFELKEDEEIKRILEFPDYWVSNYGNVFSTWSGGFLYQTQSKTNGGHMNVILSLKTGEIKHAEVHRLVLMAFNYIPGCENLDVNHKDNIPWNNWL